MAASGATGAAASRGSMDGLSWRASTRDPHSRDSTPASLSSPTHRAPFQHLRLVSIPAFVLLHFQPNTARLYQAMDSLPKRRGSGQGVSCNQTTKGASIRSLPVYCPFVTFWLASLSILGSHSQLSCCSQPLRTASSRCWVLTQLQVTH